ncbi:hypothetical protein R1sor_000222 [Riccia sorocarpa]|uniref:Uncharacterized protein n=1 Tax=Riccia sorocarpa TaxID=122646 RepID=A0ABD3GSI0_9MARC
MWQSTAKFLAPTKDLALPPWKRLSIWGPKTPGVRNVTRSAATGSFARLREAGITVIGDITMDGTTSKHIQEIAPQLSSSTLICRAYDRILDSSPKHAAGFRTASKFAVSKGHSSEPTWALKLKDDAPTDDRILNTSHATTGYQRTFNTCFGVARQSLNYGNGRSTSYTWHSARQGDGRQVLKKLFSELISRRIRGEMVGNMANVHPMDDMVPKKRQGFP